MHTKKLSAGDIIDARCTRCKAVLNHRIVAMVGDKVVRVECNTCGGTHNYYPPPTPTTLRSVGTGSTAAARTPSTSPRSPRREPGVADRDEWAALRPSMAIEQALPYAMGSRYKVDNLINHPVFGIGIVRQLVPPNKMQVLFEDGVKLLRCG